MSTPISFIETSDDASVFGGDVGDQIALRLDPTRRCMLRFEIRLSQSDDMEALRYARRAMIREERSRGLEWEEPSMEDRTFTAREIRWFVSQASWCRKKIADLFERANRACAALNALQG
jgi:hypothetical protein